MTAQEFLDAQAADHDSKNIEKFCRPKAFCISRAFGFDLSQKVFSKIFKMKGRRGLEGENKHQFLLSSEQTAQRSAPSGFSPDQPPLALTPTRIATP